MHGQTWPGLDDKPSRRRRQCIPRLSARRITDAKAGTARISKAERQTRRAGASVATSDRAPAFADQVQPGTRPLAREVTLESLDQSTCAGRPRASNELRALESRLTELKVPPFSGSSNSTACGLQSRGLDATRWKVRTTTWPSSSVSGDNCLPMDRYNFSLLRGRATRTSRCSRRSWTKSARLSIAWNWLTGSRKPRRSSPGTHLVIETMDKSLETMRLFRASLKSHSTLVLE